MKLIPLLAVATILSACSANIARPFDPTEYNYSVQIATNATHAVHRCADINSLEFKTFAQATNLDSFTLVEYVANKSESKNTLPAVNEIRTLVQELLGRSDMSLMYCKHKLSNIQASARMYSRAIANSDRFKVCDGNVSDRYVLFAASYKAGTLRVDEFKELVHDLLRLKNIDTNGCTIEEKNKLQDSFNFIQLAASIIGVL